MLPHYPHTSNKLKSTYQDVLYKPSTDGEKIIKLSYKNSPYFTSANAESSAVLYVRSNPRSMWQNSTTFITINALHVSNHINSFTSISWGGELETHLPQCGLGWGLPPYQVASWSIQPFSHNRHRPKNRGSAPFLGRGAGSPSSTMWPGPRPTSIPFWSIQPFGHKRHGTKIWEGVHPFLVRGSWVPM